MNATNRPPSGLSGLSSSHLHCSLTSQGDGPRELPALLCTLLPIFPHTAVFADAEDSAVKNYVIVASDTALPRASQELLGQRPADLQRLCGADAACLTTLRALPQRAFDLGSASEACDGLDRTAAFGKGRKSGWKQRGELAADHWTVMRHQIPDAVWSSGI